MLKFPAKSHTQVFHMEGYPHQIVRFGVFDADLQTGELRKNGIKVALQGQPFQVFAILLEHSGQLVTREELRQRVWPKDTFVDFDHALNTAITKIRMALGDDADNPRFVETLPRRGYRFIVSVDRPSLVAPLPREPKGRFDRGTKKGSWVRVGAALLVLLFAIGIWRFGIPATWFSSSPQAQKGIPLTSYPGRQCCPSFSPDGNQVAFVWTRPNQDNFEIYVKLVGTENAVRLTTDPAHDFTPAWSPDGRFIAFLRVLPTPRRLGVFLVSPIGGPERKLTEISGDFRPDPWSRGGLSWFPDSQALALSDQGRIIMVSVNSGEKRTLTLPLRAGTGQFDDTPAVSPDGRKVVFSRIFAAVSEIYLLTLSQDLSPNGEPKQLTFKGQWSRDPLWAVNGREVIFSSGPLSYAEGVAELWRMPVSESGGPVRPHFIGVQGATPAISRQGNRLAYMRTLTDANIWRLELSRPWGKTTESVSFISSTYSESSPQYSPDGKRVVFCSTRSGTREIWLASADGSNPLQLTSFGAAMTGAPRWSPDGQQIVFDSTAAGAFDVYVIDANGGQPRRLTDHPEDDAVASYSRDGRWIYFLSRRSGRNEIWKIPAEGGQAVQVTQNGGWIAFESPDGKMLYYAKNLWDSSLWKMPVEGGEEKEIVKSIVGFSFSIAKKGIYFQQLNVDRSTSIKFFSFATGGVVLVATIRRPLLG